MKNNMNKKKVFVLGIDGATYSVISPLINQGKLPNFQKLISRGVHGVLHSTIPSLSAPAWVAFMTGRNPGHYATYHFRKINIKEYQNIHSQDLINSSSFSGTTFFDYLGELGYTVGVVTVPVTYPPWKVNGFLVSGYPCPDPADNPNYTFPQFLSREILENLNWTEKEHAGSISKGELRGASDPGDILDGGLAMMSRRTHYTLKLMKQFNSDVTVLVWGEIDRAQHKIWKYHDPDHVLHPSDGKYKSYLERLYCHADNLLGTIVSNLSPDTNLFILSDHGFGPKQGSYFHVNAWLEMHGYMKARLKSKLLNNPLLNSLKGPIRSFVMKRNVSTRKKIRDAKGRFTVGAIDFEQTLVYRFPVDEQTEGIVINLKGRQQSGTVTGERYETLRTELIDRLKEFKDPRNGKYVIKRCVRREDIYAGEKMMDAPDIICTLHEGYYIGSRVEGDLITPIPEAHIDSMSGNHRPEGIFLASGPGIREGTSFEKADIIDVAPSLIYALGERIPESIEGKVITSIFSDECLRNAPQFVEYEFCVNNESVSLSSVEEESMKDKLKDMGYL